MLKGDRKGPIPAPTLTMMTKSAGGALMDEFRYTSYAQEIIFGAGSLARLGEAVERFSWRRLMLCSTGSQRRNGHIGAIENVLGERLMASYESIASHVPDVQVAEASALAYESEIDAVIGLGGGSSIGMAKAVSLAVEEKRSGRPARAAIPTEQPLVAVVAIPTTYAGSEMTPTYGITHHEHGSTRKITVTDAKVTPKLVIYDPILTLDLRTEMLMGAFLAGTALAHVAMALHHGLCHVLGGTAGVPHGVANSIILPHAMRFNLGAAASELAQAAEAMGIARAGKSDESAAEEAID